MVDGRAVLGVLPVDRDPFTPTKPARWLFRQPGGVSDVEVGVHGVSLPRRARIRAPCRVPPPGGQHPDRARTGCPSIRQVNPAPEKSMPRRDHLARRSQPSGRIAGAVPRGTTPARWRARGRWGVISHHCRLRTRSRPSFPTGRMGRDGRGNACWDGLIYAGAC